MVRYNKQDLHASVRTIGKRAPTWRRIIRGNGRNSEDYRAQSSCLAVVTRKWPNIPNRPLGIFWCSCKTTSETKVGQEKRNQLKATYTTIIGTKTGVPKSSPPGDAEEPGSLSYQAGNDSSQKGEIPAESDVLMTENPTPLVPWGLDLGNPVK